MSYRTPIPNRVCALYREVGGTSHGLSALILGSDSISDAARSAGALAEMYSGSWRKRPDKVRRKWTRVGSDRCESTEKYMKDCI